MERQSIAQEYLIFVTNEKGKLPASNGLETKAGTAVAGIMDLIQANVIKIEKKKIEVIGKLPEELIFLTSLYEYLREKPHSLNKVMEDYGLSLTDARLNQLIMDTGEALEALGAVREEKGGLLGNKGLFVPQTEWKEELINCLKTEIIQNEDISFHDIALVSLLKETGNLKKYYSKNEAGSIQDKLKGMKANPDGKIIKQMLCYLDEAMAAMIAAISVTAT